MHRLHPKYIVMALPWVLLTSISATVSISPEPIEDRMRRADFVCLCLVTSIRQTNSARMPNGRLGTADFEAVLAPTRIYKGSADGVPRTLFFAKLDELAGPPVRKDRSYLLFLKYVTPDRFQLLESSGSVVGLTLFATAGKDVSGDEALQADIRESIASSKSDRVTREQLEILSQFRRLDSLSMQLLDRLSEGSIADTSVLCLYMLTRSAGNNIFDKSRWMPYSW